MRRAINALAAMASALLLIWITAALAALILASDADYYKETLREVGVYSRKNEDGTEKRRIIYGVGGKMQNRVTLSDEQLDLVCEHIVDYLFGDTESFELRLDGVRGVSGIYADGVSLFGDEAVSHMADVKGLIRAARISLIPSLISFVLLLVYLIKRVRARDVLKYILFLLCGILLFAAVFCLWSYLGATPSNPFLLNLWGNLHYLIFAFQADAYEGSFLSDALVYILTLEFFLDAVARVLIAIASALALYITSLLIISRRKFP